MNVSSQNLANLPSSPPEAAFDAGKFYSRAGILFFELDAQGVLISLNSTAEEVLDCDEGDSIGKEMTLFLDPDQHARFKLLLAGTVNRGILRDEPLLLRALDGRQVAVRYNGLCQYDDSRNPVVLHLYLRDETLQSQLGRLNALATEIISFLPVDIKSAPGLLERLRVSVSATYAGFSWPEHGRMHVIDPTRPPNGIQPLALSWPAAHWESLAKAIAQQQAEGRAFGGWSSDLEALYAALPELPEETVKKSLDGLAFVSVWPVILEEGTESPAAYFYLLGHNKLDLSPEAYELIRAVVPHLRVLSKPAARVESVPTASDCMINEEAPILGMMVVRDGIIARGNRWVQKFLGWPASALSGQRLVDLVSSEDQDKLAQLTGGGFDEEKEAGLSRIALRARGGETRVVEAAFQTAVVDNKPSQVWYFVSKEDERRLKAQLVQARKTEALGLLSGGLVHDFNNLMACILGYSSLLVEEINQESPYWHDIQQIFKTADEASERMTRLLAYAQSKTCFVENLDLNQLIKEVAGILSRTSDKGIMIRADLEPQLSSLRADASQMQQVILQLALNAREAMPKGGKLFFKTQNIEVGERGLWKTQGAQPGRYVQLAVSDTGQGIRPEDKEKLFDPRFTTKETERGRGYGLSFVQEIVRAHGGFISVFSEPQKGSMIKVHFPVTGGNGEKVPTKSEEVPLLGKEIILLIDEERKLQETARKMLTRYGYKVIGAQNSNEALAIYKKYQQRIDLVILDVNMRGAQIRHVVDQLNQLNPEVKILAATGRGETLESQPFAIDRFAGQVEKPYQIRPLTQTIRAALNA